MDDIDRRMARVMARLAAQREDCPACQAREERAAIQEFDGGLSREEAERQAREAHPCAHKAASPLGALAGGLAAGGIGV